MSKGTKSLIDIIGGEGIQNGMPSLCSSNPYVIEASLEYAKANDVFVLIEATANQVNQYGGYTGMQPKDFCAFVYQIADTVGCVKDRIILGGDHLGPVVFKDKPADEAMDKAETLVRAFVSAGFEKIHIDTSMRLGDDPTDQQLSDEVIAARGARLCAAAEDEYLQVFKKPANLVYVIGSEVPIPGGTQDEEEDMHITTPADLERTLEAFKNVFEAKELSDAFRRVIAVVIQPGVEFGDNSVVEYDRVKAKEVTDFVKRYPNLALEGHSTDYQIITHLKQMATDGIRILKVGPELTFALREGYFALDNILKAMNQSTEFSKTLEKTMLRRPDDWQKYYHGTEEVLRLKRKYSFSDRWRYYASDKAVNDAVNTLLSTYDKIKPPITLLSQFMPVQYVRVREGKIKNQAKALVLDKVMEIVEKYYLAVIKDKN